MKLRLLDWLLIVAVSAFDVLLLVLPPGAAILDARPYYSVAQASEFLASLGAVGAQQYLVHEALDLIFIALYSSLFRRLAERWKAGSSARWSDHVPWYAPAIFDSAETFAIILALCKAEPAEVLLGIAAFSTPAKWGAMLLTWGSLARAYWRARRA